MADLKLDEVELVRRFAEETDAIATRGAAPDCAEQLAAFHAWFDAECLQLQEQDAEPGTDLARDAEASRS
jgi:hypothetical protein